MMILELLNLTCSYRIISTLLLVSSLDLDNNWNHPTVFLSEGRIFN